MSATVRENVLYVVTEGAYLSRDHLNLVVRVEGETRLAVPIHHLEGVAVFGAATISSPAMELCGEAGVAVTFLTTNGRLMARVDAPGSGNVLLRRQQYRVADDPSLALEAARPMVAAKLRNARHLLLRTAREMPAAVEVEVLRESASALLSAAGQVPGAASLDALRGVEGNGAREYFAMFGLMASRVQPEFGFRVRSRRPPLDPVNAMLSFAYALLLNDCVGATTAAGFDPSVGFLHQDRPGRPSLALDLMEEFRPVLADRLVLSLINLRQVRPGDFVTRDGGAVEMDRGSRRALITAYQRRKQEEVRHPLLGQRMRLAEFPFVQARMLARYIRGDLPAYPACVVR